MNITRLDLTNLSFPFELSLSGVSVAKGELQRGTNLIADILYTQPFDTYVYIQLDNFGGYNIPLPHWLAAQFVLELHALPFNSELSWGIGNKETGVVYGVKKDV